MSEAPTNTTHDVEDDLAARRASADKAAGLRCHLLSKEAA
jgi:hypothetical protein